MKTMLNFLDSDDFLSKHYETSLWLGRGAVASAYAWSDVNAAMYGWDPSDGRMQLYNDGIVPVESYAEVINDIGSRRVRILKDQLYDQMVSGATLILNRLELKCSKVGLLTHRVHTWTSESRRRRGAGTATH
jgi:hypothetical protein